jgi:hypothetical protein
VNGGRWLAAITALTLPFLIRAIWFYPGAYIRPEPVPTPDYASLELSSPPIESSSAPAEPQTGGPTVLIDWAHQNNFSVSELQALLDSVGRLGGRMEVVTLSYDFSAVPVAERLKYASAYVVAAPGQEFTPGEIRSVESFVRRGGRLLVISDPTRGPVYYDPYYFSYPVLGVLGDVTAANGLLSPYGLSFSQDYLYNLRVNEGNFRNILIERFGEHPLTEGLDRLALYAARSVHTLSGTPLLIGDRYTLSSRDDLGGDLSAAALDSDGGVLALGDLSFLTPPYSEVADNSEWIDRVASFLMGGSRQRSFEDFPYLFRRPVTVITTEAFPFDADNLRALASSQASLGIHGQPVRASPEVADGGDRVVLSLWTQEEFPADLLELFDLEPPDQSDDGLMHIGGLPPFDPTGVGIMLLGDQADGSVLWLLAESDSDLTSLFDLLVFQDLSACYRQDRAALCQVGPADAFGADFGFDSGTFEPGPFDFPVEPGVGTPTPTPIP